MHDSRDVLARLRAFRSKFEGLLASARKKAARARVAPTCRPTRLRELTKLDFATAKSMQDIGRKLLQSVGFASPDDVSIQAAIEANDVFIARLEAIRDRAQTLTIE